MRPQFDPSATAPVGNSKTARTFHQFFFENKLCRNWQFNLSLTYTTHISSISSEIRRYCAGVHLQTWTMTQGHCRQWHVDIMVSI